MPTVVLAHSLDFVTWRNATRTLALHGISATDITWRIRDPADAAMQTGITAPLHADTSPRSTFGVPRAMMRLVPVSYTPGAGHIAGRNAGSL